MTRLMGGNEKRRDVVETASERRLEELGEAEG